MKHNDTLAQLAALYGIAPEYQDIKGKLRHADEATQRALQRALGAEAMSAKSERR